MMEGIDFRISYAPVSDVMAIRTLLALAASDPYMMVYTLDITNAYQNNIITDLRKRRYIRMPPSIINGFYANGLVTPPTISSPKTW